MADRNGVAPVTTSLLSRVMVGVLSLLAIGGCVITLAGVAAYNSAPKA